MNLSLGELEALAKKAARGAGLPWGLAEDAGRAVRWLDAFGLQGSAHLASYLASDRGARPDDLSAVWSSDGPLCPITAGASLSDCARRFSRGETLRLRDVSHPLLILPFVGSAAILAHRTLTVGWARTDGCCLDLSTAPGIDPIDITCEVDTDLGKAQEPTQRAEIDAATFERLTSFAARTYAPATEASRRLGAGAGNSDND